MSNCIVTMSVKKEWVSSTPATHMAKNPSAERSSSQSSEEGQKLSDNFQLENLYYCHDRQKRHLWQVRGVLQIPMYNSTVETLTKLHKFINYSTNSYWESIRCMHHTRWRLHSDDKNKHKLLSWDFPQVEIFFFAVFLILVWDGEIYPKSGDGLQVLGERILQ